MINAYKRVCCALRTWIMHVCAHVQGTLTVVGFQLKYRRRSTCGSCCFASRKYQTLARTSESIAVRARTAGMWNHMLLVMHMLLCLHVCRYLPKMPSVITRSLRCAWNEHHTLATCSQENEQQRQTAICMLYNLRCSAAAEQLFGADPHSTNRLRCPRRQRTRFS